MVKEKNKRLKILMNGVLVGWLSSSSKGILHFVYDESWLVHDKHRTVSLSLPLSSQAYYGQVVDDYFDNLLPDSQPIRNRLQRRVGATSTRAFDLLAHIGRDCVGALQLLPEDQDCDVRYIQAEPLDDKKIQALLKGYKYAPLGVDPEADFRLSVAGAQEKTALLQFKGRWCRPSGATPTSHIFKLPVGELGQSGIDLRDSIENEWLCQQLLEAFGVPAAATEIAIFGDQKVLIVERFDRSWAADGSWLMRLPQEDMCQATGTPGSIKYEVEGGPGMKPIMDILLGSVYSHDDRLMFMKAQLLFWMLGAIDGHAKNFSLFHLPRGIYRMTPLYDVISIYPVVKANQIDIQRVTIAMALLGKNKQYRWDRIVRRHWLETARKCHFDGEEMAKIIGYCCDMVPGAIEKVEEVIPKDFPEYIASSIFSGLSKARDRLIR